LDTDALATNDEDLLAPTSADADRLGPGASGRRLGIA
jgi:hypothetical protein